MAFEETSAEAVFAANLRDARTALGLTQAEIAEEMSGRGFRWHPPTVYKVEAGERQIQLGEALALASILGTTVTALATPAEELQTFLKVREDYEAFDQAVEELSDAIERFLTMATRLRVRIQETSDVERYLNKAGLKNILSYVALESPVLKAVNRAETMIKRWGTDASET